MIQLFKKQKNTQLLWVNTTPVRIIDKLGEFDSFNKRVERRNEIIEKYAEEHHIPLIDFYSIGKLYPEYYENDGVHFNKEGVRAEAKTLTNKIKEMLN